MRALPVPRGTTVRAVATAVAVYLGVRLVMLGSIVVAANVRGMHALGALTKADGYWYLRIASHGYTTVPPPHAHDFSHLPPLVFFPLYPGLIRLTAATGLPEVYAALLLTAIFGTLAAAFITAWAVPYVGGRGAVVLTVVWSLLPTSVVLDMAYSEGLFIAAAAACLLALQRERWLAAATAASVAGLTRPTAGGLVLAVWLAAGRHAWRGGRSPRVLLAALLAPAGLLAALAHVAHATGRIDGWFWLERTTWRSGFDGGWSFVRVLGRTASGAVAVQWPVVVSAVVVVAFVAALVWWLRERPPLPDLAYTAVAGLLAIGERNYPHVKPRFLLVAFPVLVPVARRLARLSTPVLMALAVPVTVASVAWNTYLVVGWPRSV